MTRHRIISGVTSHTLNRQISYRIASHHIPAYHIASYHIASHLVVSHHIKSCDTLLTTHTILTTLLWNPPSRRISRCVWGGTCWRCSTRIPSRLGTGQSVPMLSWGLRNILHCICYDAVHLHHLTKSNAMKLDRLYVISHIAASSLASHCGHRQASSFTSFCLTQSCPTISHPLLFPTRSSFLTTIEQGVNAGLEDVWTLYNELSQSDNDLEKGGRANEEFVCLLLSLASSCSRFDFTRQKSSSDFLFPRSFVHAFKHSMSHPSILSCSIWCNLPPYPILPFTALKSYEDIRLPEAQAICRCI